MNKKSPHKQKVTP